MASHYNMSDCLKIKFIELSHVLLKKILWNEFGLKKTKIFYTKQDDEGQKTDLFVLRDEGITIFPVNIPGRKLNVSLYLDLVF